MAIETSADGIEMRVSLAWSDWLTLFGQAADGNFEPWGAGEIEKNHRENAYFRGDMTKEEWHAYKIRRNRSLIFTSNGAYFPEHLPR